MRSCDAERPMPRHQMRWILLAIAAARCSRSPRLRIGGPNLHYLGKPLATALVLLALRMPLAGRHGCAAHPRGTGAVGSATCS
jgi:hypothetical protein